MLIITGTKESDLVCSHCHLSEKRATSSLSSRIYIFIYLHMYLLFKERLPHKQMNILLEQYIIKSLLSVGCGHIMM